jgi:type III pantothenate kinase
MKLFIDIGNSRIKWLLTDGVKPVEDGWCLHGDYVHAFERIDVSALDGIYAISVAAEEVGCAALSYLAQRCGRQVTMLETGIACCGVLNGYDVPQQLGVDRWAAMIGARQRFKTPLCVVDCGSAVTIDVLDAEGQHLGGYIVPGLTMQRQLLRQGTAAVDVCSGKSSDMDWGNDTVSCVARGGIEAIAGLIERSHRKLTQHSGEEVVTVVTGGDAAVILPWLEFPAHHEERLVLSGIVQMVRELEG